MRTEKEIEDLARVIRAAYRDVNGNSGGFDESLTESWIAEARAAFEHFDAHHDAETAILLKQHDRQVDVLSQYFQCGKPYNRFARIGESVVDALPRFVSEFERISKINASLPTRYEVLEIIYNCDSSVSVGFAGKLTDAIMARLTGGKP